MAAAIVQEIGRDGGLTGNNLSGGGPFTLTTSHAVTAGNKIVLVVYQSGGTVTGVTDNGPGYTYTVDCAIQNTSAGGQKPGISIVEADAASGLASGKVFTITLTGSGSHFLVVAYEVSGATTGAAVAGDMSTAQAVSNNPSSGATANSAASGDLVLGALGWDSSQGSTGHVTAGTGYSLNMEDATNFFLSHCTEAVESRTNLSGAANAGFSLDGTNQNVTAVVIFRQTSSASSWTGSAALSGAGQIAATGFGSRFRSAALQGLGQLAAGAVRTVFGAAALIGRGQIAATASAIDVSVSGTDITVTATGPATVAQMVAAINLSPAASALVVASIPSGDGSNGVTAL